MKFQLSYIFSKREIMQYWRYLLRFFDQPFKYQMFKPDTNLRFCVDYSSIYYIIQLIKK